MIFLTEAEMLLLYWFLDEEVLSNFLGGPEVTAEALRLAKRFDLGVALLAFLAGIRFERDLPGQFDLERYLAPSTDPNF